MRNNSKDNKSERSFFSGWGFSLFQKKEKEWDDVWNDVSSDEGDSELDNLESGYKSSSIIERTSLAITPSSSHEKKEPYVRVELYRFFSFVSSFFSATVSMQPSSNQTISSAAVISIELNTLGHKKVNSEKGPNIQSRDGFKVTSSITQHALKLMGRIATDGEYISTKEVKELRKKSSLATHPDKTRKSDSEPFDQVQRGYIMLLEEEYNPDETEEDKKIRQNRLLSTEVIPAMNKDISLLSEKLEKSNTDEFDERYDQIMREFSLK